MIGGLVAKHAIQRLRAPLIDDGRGNKTRDWGQVQAANLTGWAVDTSSTTADLQNRDGSSALYTLRGPFGADIESTDRIVLMGDTYRIDGNVLRQPGPTSVTSHTLIRLLRWEG